ncbi:hypothetical protein D7B24_006982 [Verticillium nonalfalfae]|uniref:Ribosomal protein bL31m N-terminal domain-containing protein n=1 Tax=Verticillium nonalfalfae TaxID=1051616 RepID=A0A3M9Y8B2_9PEZI|nr:uncharacterized protein D7B24_006982 [Verticillium nonalfalfae]RNJ56733.1 hypothetical protein D7B24_006982 [Verticillium nonalfalfae]
MASLPSALARRPLLLHTTTKTTTGSFLPTQPAHLAARQSRAATYIHRPRRPYTFTQLVQLSDGSTFTARTTSPAPLHRADKDSRNHILWQPSEKTLHNVELDEAGKLAAFRQRFGRGFDLLDAASEEADAQAAGDKGKGKGKSDGAVEEVDEEEVWDMGDLISGYSTPMEEPKAPVFHKKTKGKK